MKFRRFAAVFTLAATMAAPALAAEWTVGANIGNVPWEFQDAQGKFVGFEIDLVNEVAKRTGNTVKIENIPFNGLFPAVLSGRIQIAISSITITPKRLETLAFAQPYYDSDQSLSVLKASPINKLEDLSGKTVGVDTASTGDIWATENTGKYKIAKISRYEGLAPAMLDLAAGAHRRLHQRHPGRRVLHQGQAAVPRGRPHPDRRALFVHVREDLRRRRKSERRADRAEEGRLHRQDAPEVVRQHAAGRRRHGEGAGHAEVIG
jgi:hypothetical protein